MMPSEMNERYFEGDHDAIIEALRPYIGFTARTYGDQQFYSGVDAFSDGLEALTKALYDWEPGGGYKYFAHYAKQKIRWAMGNGRNKQINRSKVAYHALVSHTEMLHQDRYDREAQNEATLILKRVAEKADGKVREMVRLKSKGLSNVQVGELMGLHNSYVSRKLGELYDEVAA